MHRVLIALALCLGSVPAFAQPPNCAVGGFIVATNGTIWVCNGLGSPATQVPAASAVWGAITGTLSAQSDLQTALNAKGTSNFSGAYADLTGKPTLGTAAATASTDYATAAQGTTANSALQPAGNGSALTGLTKAQVGLSNVDNTADASKSVSSAATLTTPRTINSVSFNGSADITVTAAAGTLSGATLAAGVTASSLASFGAAAAFTTTNTFGYATGAGGAVTQATSKSTGATLNKACGDITLNAAALAAATIVSFTLTNSFVGANDVIHAQHQATGTFGAYTINARAAAGSAVFSLRNNSAASLAEAIVIRYCVIKGAVA